MCTAPGGGDGTESERKQDAIIICILILLVAGEKENGLHKGVLAVPSQSGLMIFDIFQYL